LERSVERTGFLGEVRKKKHKCPAEKPQKKPKNQKKGGRNNLGKKKKKKAFAVTGSVEGKCLERVDNNKTL